MVKVVDPNDDEDYEYVGMLFADMPQSSIVHGYVTHHGHISNRFKKIARLLYEKDNWNMDMDELVIVFDDVIHEVWLWMKQSFARLQNFEMSLMLEQNQNDINLSVTPKHMVPNHTPQPSMELTIASLQNPTMRPTMGLTL